MSGLDLFKAWTEFLSWLLIEYLTVASSDSLYLLVLGGGGLGLL